MTETSTTAEHADPSSEAAQLAASVLDAEAEREARQAAAQEQVVFADDLLPGVGTDVSLRGALRVGGLSTFVVLILLNSLDELESATLGVLAPDIRDAFGVSNSVIVFLSAASGAFLVLGALPMGLLADRYRRPPIIGWASLVFAAFVASCGLVANAFQLFWARLGVGIAKSNSLPVHGSLIADTYPIGARGRVSATMAMGGRLVGTLSPVLVGGIAALAGGADGWRWPFLLLGIPVAVVAFFAFRLPEPPRGQFEKQDVLGQVIEDKAPAPISVEAAFARLWQIRTIKTVIVAFAAIGFGLFTTGVLANLFMEEQYGTKTFERGVFGTIGGIGVLIALPLAGRSYDRMYRQDPSRALRLVGMMILPAALLTPAQYLMPNVVLFTIMGIPQMILLSVAFTMVGPVLQTITPYRLRGMGSALGSIYIFLIGATGGALLSGVLSDEFGPGVAVVAIVVPSTVIGGYLIIRSARFIRNDLSLVVAELREELDEHTRQLEAPAAIPALQVADVDYSYGPVQVLFDVDFEVRPGEVLALLGTNGAGKSTILRVIAGLGTPARGVVRLHGRNVTYTTPEQRARLGIRILLGGKGVFPAMTVNENLEMAAFVYRRDGADFRRRLDRAYELFPTLSQRRGELASALSGGQQQMLALAMTLLHDPEVLAIDELSLGLAPLVVQELLVVVERLRSEGMTIIIVEQSLNVALSVADRAVFLEKGEVRFSGPAAELAERDDLARGVPGDRRRLNVGVVGAWITSQLVFSGVVSGLLYGMLAMGIVLIYRSTRVINFAVGNMGLVGASLLALLAVNYGIPFWLAAIAALVLGTLFGVVMELIVIRRLFFAPRVIVLVATIGISGLSLAIVAAYPEITDFSAVYPVPADTTWNDVAGIRITSAQIAVLIVVPLVAVALGWFLNRTLLGRTVKASAENPDLARVQGINPKIVSTAVWAIAGFVSTLTMILVAGDNAGPAGDLLFLGPNTLVRALAAAVIAGMVSFPRALLAGVAIGVAQALLNFNFLDKPGLIDALIFVAVLVAVAVQSRRSGPAETQTFSFAPKVREIPDQLREVWWVRRMNVLVLGTLAAVAIAVPLVITAPSRHLLYATICCFAICGLSLTVLTGWAGQLSLGQMAFAGFGALVAAALTRGLDLDLGVVALQLAGLPFLLSIVLAAFVTAGLAALIGIGALRVRGLLLAVSTFAFAVAAQQYLFHQPVLSDDQNVVPFPRGTLFGLDLSSQRAYYYVALAVLIGAVAVVSRLRRSGIGRTTIAVRDNADRAAAYTVGTASTKLRAFAVAGFLAGLGGALLAGVIESVPYTERFFLVADSLGLVAIVVIGGIASPMGAVIGALWVIGLPAFFPDNNLVPLFTSSLGLLLLLLYFPGGFVQIAYSVRDALVGWAANRVGAQPTTPRVPTPAMLQRPERPPIPGDAPALEVASVSVRFGGIAAVDDVSLSVGNDEIVGLIGTNGAGKSTLMNAIGDFVPATGTIRLHGDDVSGMSAARRTRDGLGRTFQAARLFPELTVRETVEVALEARGRTGFLSTALFLPHSYVHERARRSEADDLIGFLGLGRYATTRISDLSTGTRRIVELAGLLALDARVLCLDEPTAGVAQRETEAFGPLIKELRRELGAAMLIVEHDMPLIMGISDRVYCLEVGRVIAEGVPDVVRNDARVVASYLGVDERAIARSGAIAPGIAKETPTVREPLRG